MAKARGMTVKDRTGQKFGLLTALWRGPNHVEPSGAIRAQWVCLCDCGETHTTTGHALQRGLVRSCGCLNAVKGVTHGMSRTAVYRQWSSMLQRCRNPNSTAFPRYGGRGIDVCDRWEAFDAFYADMGEPQPGQSIDRIDNERGYSPDNCRWASRIEQANNRSTNEFLTYAGKTLTIAEWGRVTGFGAKLLQGRMRLGWPADRTLTEPINPPSEIARLSHINRRKAPS